MIINVYSKPNCMQCDATEKELKKLKLDFTKIDVTKDDKSFDYISAKGYKSMPVVIVDNEVEWTGFRPDLIKALVE